MADEVLRDTDGMQLLYNDQVAEIAGVLTSTINSYAAESKRQRKATHRSSPKLLPRPVKKVRRTLIKSDGRPVVVWAQVWRQDAVLAWVAARKGK